jgi:hypothetical protein
VIALAYDFQVAADCADPARAGGLVGRDARRGGGGTFLHKGSQGPHEWLTLADPEGNEFCVG